MPTYLFCFAKMRSMAFLKLWTILMFLAKAFWYQPSILGDIFCLRFSGPNIPWIWTPSKERHDTKSFQYPLLFWSRILWHLSLHFTRKFLIFLPVCQFFHYRYSFTFWKTFVFFYWQCKELWDWVKTIFGQILTKNAKCLLKLNVKEQFFYEKTHNSYHIITFLSKRCLLHKNFSAELCYSNFESQAYI